MFKREHHQAIDQVLHALDGKLLKEHDCLFGGGTAIALRYGEFRQSVDMDFLVSSPTGYRELRQLARDGIQALCLNRQLPFAQTTDIRIDQYGIRTMLSVVGREIKFEIIREARIELEPPGSDDEISGIATLTPLDMATSKLLANADRWNDDGTFNRDIIDLALMEPSRQLLDEAIAKATTAYGEAILIDLAKAVDRMENRDGWMEHCMEVMAIDMPKAVLWKHIRKLKMVKRG